MLAWLGQVPVLETAEGGVFESNAIARYVASLSDVGLLGKTDFEQVCTAWVQTKSCRLPSYAYRKAFLYAKLPAVQQP